MNTIMLVFLLVAGYFVLVAAKGQDSILIRALMDHTGENEGKQFNNLCSSFYFI